jgi:hypothetical protein
VFVETWPQGLRETVHHLGSDDAVNAARGGRITDAKSVVALLLAAGAPRD